MSNISDRFVVVLDANVLYPFRIRDTLLRFCEAGLFRARWSPTILSEWKTSLLFRKPELADSIDAQLAAMETAFPEGLVTGYEDLIPSITLPDPDDRHVVAAAIVADAEHIITENMKDFPQDLLSKYGIEAVAPDDFLSSTFELYSATAAQALRKMRRDYKNPAMDRSAFLNDMQKCGLPKLVSLAKEHIDAI